MNKGQIYIYIAWVIAFVATLGSLFFSEIMKFPPCVLCWYQRIAMYPLAVLFIVGTFVGAKETLYFTAPVAFIGWFIAVYHNLLHYGIIPESASPCISGVPCSTVYINWFGFLTIPMMAFIAFSLILVCLFLLQKEIKNEK